MTTHRVKITWVMRMAHIRADKTKHQFDTYKQALAVSLRKMWKVMKGEELSREEIVLYNHYQYFVNTGIGFVDAITMKNAS